MKAISLWQPWASLWCSGRKIHETRHWATKHRGWLVVHAAKKFVKDFDSESHLRGILEDEFGGHWGMDLPTGALIGMVHIVACTPTAEIPISKDSSLEAITDYHCGDFSPGRFGWRADKFRTFKTPIPYIGRQSMFSVPDAVLVHQLAEAA